MSLNPMSNFDKLSHEQSGMNPDSIGLDLGVGTSDLNGSSLHGSCIFKFFVINPSFFSISLVLFGSAYKPENTNHINENLFCASVLYWIAGTGRLDSEIKENVEKGLNLTHFHPMHISMIQEKLSYMRTIRNLNLRIETHMHVLVQDQE